MHQTRQGNQWFFGVKGQIGVDKDSGLIHSVVTTVAHVSDGVVAAELLHGEERVVYGDVVDQGLEKREEMAGSGAGLSYRHGAREAPPPA